MKGHVRKRGKAWAVVIELDKDPDGKRRQKWHTVQGNKKDAERELTRLLHEINTGVYADTNRMLVADYLQRWLNDYARSSVAPKTYERYADIVNKHLSPALGQFQLAKLRPLHIQAMLTDALDHGRLNGTGGLSARTVVHHHRVLHGALQQAVRWQLLPYNPSDGAVPPRAERKEMQVLDEEQTARLLAAAEGTRMYAPVLVAVTTGMRRGELLGLRWADVDLDEAVCSVQQALSTTADGLAFREPKTGKSRRSIALMPVTVKALKRHRVQQRWDKRRLDVVFDDHGLVFPAENGQPWHPDTFSVHWRKLATTAGVSIRLHDLRHSHATQLLRQGIHPKVVSERLGHSTIVLTMDVYSHVLPDMQEAAALKLDGALATARQKVKDEGQDKAKAG